MIENAERLAESPMHDVEVDVDTWTFDDRGSIIDPVVKVFVSGQIDEIQPIRAVYRLLEDAGCKITHDWTIGDPLIDKSAQRDEAGKRAYLDIAGVVDSDIYILMSNNRLVGKGMYAELGAALALQQIAGSPEVFVVGPMNHQSIFYLHPDVKHREKIEDVVTEISSRFNAAQ
ncbi:hypothetical protein [Actinokineospora sp. HUAS TT18]|uniref:hypothetical protein n=1 Tax=Actinokineospora sp. HUAS TT18 TaxID=3447451 RepID=UPI003F525133